MSFEVRCAVRGRGGNPGEEGARDTRGGEEGGGGRGGQDNGMDRIRQDRTGQD